MKTPAQTLRLSILAMATAVLLPAGLFADDHDDKIEKSFEESYTNRTQLRDSDISVDSKNGVVTIKGSVENSEQKRLAEDTVRSLPGVTTVHNELKVKSDPKEASDEWIALKARSSLLYHRNVSLMDTDVKVIDGNVTLTGTAESAAEKSLAGEYVADIKGVKNVNNQIVVATRTDKERAEMAANREKSEWKSERDREQARLDAKYDSPRRDVGDKMDDASITAQVKGSLAVHRSTSAIRTEVSTMDGVVTLRGEARNSAEKQLAAKVAKDIRGVRDVKNEIVVTNAVAGE